MNWKISRLAGCLLLFSTLAAAAGGPQNAFRQKLLKFVTEDGMPGPQLDPLQIEFASVKAADTDPAHNEAWESLDRALAGMRKFFDDFEPLKSRYAGEQRQPAVPDEVELVRSDLHQVFSALGIDYSKDPGLERTYLSQIAPLAAIDPDVRASVIRTMEGMKFSGDMEDYRVQILGAVKAGNFKEARDSLRQMYNRAIATERSSADVHAMATMLETGVTDRLMAPPDGISFAANYQRLKPLNDCGQDCVIATLDPEMAKLAKKKDGWGVNIVFVFIAIFSLWAPVRAFARTGTIPGAVESLTLAEWRRLAIGIVALLIIYTSK